MSNLVEARSDIQLEETQFRYGVSESMAQKMGQSINFINRRQYDEKTWVINGAPSLIVTPAFRFDGYTMVEFDADIVDVFAYVQVAGTSGTVEFDIKKASSPGGAWTSIFSTTPKISYSSGDDAWVYVGSTLSGSTAPILSVTNMNAHDVLRLDILQTQGGISFNGCGVTVFYRPR